MRKIMSICAVVACGLILFSCKGNQPKSEPDIKGTNVPGVRGDYNSASDKEVEDTGLGKSEESNYNHSPKPNYKLPKPDLKRIKSDLVGRKISEGVSDGYFRQGWTYTIESGQVGDIELLETVVDNNEICIAEIRAEIKQNGNYNYVSTLKVQYLNTPQQGWILDNVTSLGLEIVSNGYYDDCISSERYYSDLWVALHNNSESALIVGGRGQNEQGWYHFYDVIPGHGKEDYYAPGGFIIDFVLKEY